MTSNGVSCLCGAVGCDGTQCNPIAYALAQARQEIERLRPAAESWESYVAAQERKGQPIEALQQKITEGHAHRVWQIAYTIEQMNEDQLLYELSPLIRELKAAAISLGGGSPSETSARLTEEEAKRVGEVERELAVLKKDGAAYNTRRIAGQALEVMFLMHKKLISSPVETTGMQRAVEMARRQTDHDFADFDKAVEFRDKLRSMDSNPQRARPISEQEANERLADAMRSENGNGEQNV